jgi:hypothetical protein
VRSSPLITAPCDEMVLHAGLNTTAAEGLRAACRGIHEGRGGDARAESAIGVPARGPNSQIQAMLIARKSGWHGEGLQTATRDAPVPHKQTSGGIQRP